MPGAAAPGWIAPAQVPLFAAPAPSPSDLGPTTLDLAHEAELLLLPGALVLGT